MVILVLLSYLFHLISLLFSKFNIIVFYINNTARHLTFIKKAIIGLCERIRLVRVPIDIKGLETMVFGRRSEPFWREQLAGLQVLRSLQLLILRLGLQIRFLLRSYLFLDLVDPHVQKINLILSDVRLQFANGFR